MDDKCLIPRIKQNDRSAFDSFCIKYYPALLSYAKVILSDDWAEDVVQDVLFSVWTRRHNLSDEGSVKNYLFRSVHNRCLNYISSCRKSDNFKEWNSLRISELALDAMDYMRNPSIRRLYERDLRESLNAAIDSLPPKCREVFRLSYIEGLSNKEISSRLEISLSTVENHMYTALKHLRSRLTYEGVYLTFLSYFLKNLL